MARQAFARVSVRNRLTCPHCWAVFPATETHWVSESPDLLGDPRLGSDDQLRFLPSRFDVAGNAIDPSGAVCQHLACPNCHLAIPRALLELTPLFVSIVGAPSCGKTYFLAAMIRQLRAILPECFSISITDADPQSNKVLNDYIEQQFFNSQDDEVVRLAKTEEQGDLYSTVHFDERMVTLPMPLLFSITPNARHPSRGRRKLHSRLLCLYDNAGESFLPGKDTGQNQVTRHLAKSEVILFLFDPTQDTKFRDKCREITDDPQIVEGTVTSRQETLLHELAQRVRRHAHLKESDQHGKPLIVVVTKYDAWSKLFEEQPLDTLVRRRPERDTGQFDVKTVEVISKRLRDLLWQFSPELVSSAESFAKRVLYVPVSAMGKRPEYEPTTGRLGIRPRDISPRWAEVPLLWTLSTRCSGLLNVRIGNNDKVT